MLLSELSSEWVVQLPAQLGHIVYFIVFPILLLAAIGWVLQRRMGLDMPTLTRLTFYFVMPGMTYTAIVTANVTPGDILRVVLFSLAMIAALGVVTLLLAWVRRVPRDHRNTLLMTTIFYNAANYGLPLQKFAFEAEGKGDEAFSLQTFVVITQNIVNFTLGVWLAATGRKQIHWKESLAHILKFPPLYALAAAFLTLYAKSALGSSGPGVLHALQPFYDVVLYVKDAFIAVSIVTLGAQLANVSHGAHSYPVKLSVVVKLLLGPLIGLGLIYLFDLNGFLAQLLLISTASPTAVNVMLLCLQFDNHPEYAARAVFYSTLLSPISVTLVIFLAKGGFLARLAMN